MLNKIGGENALPIDESASALGVHEFSLLSRIQRGELNSVRARSGELLIPVQEIERLAGAHFGEIKIPSKYRAENLGDDQLGIQHKHGGLHRKDERPSYRISGSPERFSIGEIKSYRAAFGEIAAQVEALSRLKRQLSSQASAPPETQTQSLPGDEWQVRSNILDLGQSQILLCEQNGRCAVIEHFRQNSGYAQANGTLSILSEGDDARQLMEEFRANARLTLEFMASNLVATAQKIVWEQFPNERPTTIVAAISERCRQAIVNDQTVCQDKKQTHSTKRGVRI